MKRKRRLFKRSSSLDDRLVEETTKLRSVAETLEPGRERDEVLLKIRRHETASHLTEWLNSPGLKPPT
jgi:hypothetical protein